MSRSIIFAVRLHAFASEFLKPFAVLSTVAVTVLFPVPAQADSWKIDPSHSAALFSVRHMMVSNVRGDFSNVSGTVEYDPQKPTNAKVDAKIDVSTINTGDAKRDEHLRNKDFFDVEKFPHMTFVSKKFIKSGTSKSQTANKMRVIGDLTLHGVTKEVVLELDGPTDVVTDKKGNSRMGATATTKINRKDFGMTYNSVLDTGGVAIGEEIPITIELELHKSKEKDVATSK